MKTHTWNSPDSPPVTPLHPLPFQRYFYGISTVVLRFLTVKVPSIYRNTTVEMAADAAVE